MDVLRRNNVTVSGEGTQPIVFSHGYGCDLNAWRDVAPAFERDFKVVLFDHVGAGGSDLSAYEPKKYESLHGYARDTIEVLETLGIENAIFVGHSVSAMIGGLASIASPAHFSSVVMICPSPCYIDDGKGYVGGFTRTDIDGLLEVLDSNFLGWSRATAPAIIGNADRPELGHRLTESFCRTDPEIAKQFARVTFLSDNRADLPKMAKRSLVLQTREDMIAPPGVGEFVHCALPDSKLVIMNASGHCPHMSAPDETIAAINAFVGH